MSISKKVFSGFLDFFLIFTYPHFVRFSNFSFYLAFIKFINLVNKSFIHQINENKLAKLKKIVYKK